MNIPPGPRYLVQLSFRSAFPIIIVYGLLRLVNQQTGTGMPVWLALFVSFLAQPVIFLAKGYYTRYTDAKKAASLGAVLPLSVQESGFAITKAIINSFYNGYLGDIFLDWINNYGYTYQLQLPTENRLVTFEPDHIKIILATQFESFEKGPLLYQQFVSLLGTGVFNSDGEMWKFHRSMTRPFFSRDRISHFDVFAQHADDALNQAKTRLNEGYPIDFQDLVSRFTLDSATQFLFGHDVGSLSAGLPYPAWPGVHNTSAYENHPSNLFVKAFIAGQEQTALRSRFGHSWPLFEFWSDKVKPLRKVVDDFVQPLLEEALTKKRAGGKMEKVVEVEEGAEAETLLDHMITHTEDSTVIKDELVNLLVASRDTTAATLSFCLYMMTEHPDITRRLREEILGQLGTTNRPTFEDMRDMRYLRAFINEVLRLFPAVPFNSRTSNQPLVLQSKEPGSKSYYVPANTKCFYGVYLMHRRTDLWGPDALEFDPDRFLDSRLHKYLTPNPFIFCPFNAGPRICLGQQFAYHETSFFIICLLQQFSEFSLAPDAQPQESIPPASWKNESGRQANEKIILGSHLTMYVKGGLWVRMTEAKRDD